MKINQKKAFKISVAVITIVVSFAVGTTLGINNKPQTVVANDEQCKVNESVFCQEIASETKKVKAKKNYKVKPAKVLVGQPQTAVASSGGGKYVYDVQVRGSVRTSLGSFAGSVAQTLADARGWAQKGAFSRGATTSFIIVLTSAANVPSFSSACSSSWSCRVGPYVIINEDRWLGATPSWNSAGGNLRDYQHMVINHEVGHWLGNGHVNCGGAGQPAPIMQQQSINLQGCRHNAWPLPSEL